MSDQRVVCAACLHRKTGMVFLGARHYDSLMRKHLKLVFGYKMYMQDEPFIEGFIDQFNKFLTREEAHVIATKQNQIIRRCGGDEERLYSENLY